MRALSQRLLPVRHCIGPDTFLHSRDASLHPARAAQGPLPPRQSTPVSPCRPSASTAASIAVAAPLAVLGPHQAAHASSSPSSLRFELATTSSSASSSSCQLLIASHHTYATSPRARAARARAARARAARIPAPHVPAPHVPAPHVPGPHVPAPHVPAPHRAGVSRRIRLLTPDPRLASRASLTQHPLPVHGRRSPGRMTRMESRPSMPRPDPEPQTVDAIRVLAIVHSHTQSRDYARPAAPRRIPAAPPRRRPSRAPSQEVPRAASCLTHKSFAAQTCPPLAAKCELNLLISSSVSEFSFTIPHESPCAIWIVSTGNDVRTGWFHVICLRFDIILNTTDESYGSKAAILPSLPGPQPIEMIPRHSSDSCAGSECSSA